MRNSELENLVNLDPITDLYDVAASDSRQFKIVFCDSNTLNTPYSQGLTTSSSGYAYINGDINHYITILFVSTGLKEIFVASRKAGTWSQFMQLHSNWRGTAIPQNADLNDYIEPGIYRSAGSSVTSTLDNLPGGFSAGFRLEVKAISSTNFIKQIIYPDDGPNQVFYIRQYDNGPWYDWVKFSGTPV